MKKILILIVTIGLVFGLIGVGTQSSFSDVETSRGNTFQAGTWGNPGAESDTTPPVITLIGDETVNLKVGDSYEDEGATAEDDVDGDITANIVVGGDVADTTTAGTYIITYNVSDAAGNEAEEVTRTVIVSEESDTTPPVITLIGDETVNLTVGDSYEDQGATAEDDVDGDITANIVVGGDVADTTTAGTYIITYNVSDAAGNEAEEVTRTVIVCQ